MGYCSKYSHLVPKPPQKEHFSKCNNSINNNYYFIIISYRTYIKTRTCWHFHSLLEVLLGNHIVFPIHFKGKSIQFSLKKVGIIDCKSILFETKDTKRRNEIKNKVSLMNIQHNISHILKSYISCASVHSSICDFYIGELHVNFHLQQVIVNSQNNWLPLCQGAQLVKHCTSITEVTAGSHS